jgi:PD-(D/E)XK endonuclease
VLGIGERLLRVQCKWGSLKGEVVCVRVSSSYHSPTRGYVKATYEEAEVDLIAVYCGDLERCYLLPVGLVTGKSRIHLRLRPAKNNQRAALNLAAAYELRGAIAQLEERLTGSQEVAGSSPASSTFDLATAIKASFPGRDDFADPAGDAVGEAGGEAWAARSQTRGDPCR